MGHEKLKSPEIRQKRHHRSAKRETMKEASAAAESLLLLQAVDEGASSAIQEEDLSVRTQTEVDSVLMEGMTRELQELRLENIDLKQQAAVSKLCLEDLEGKDDKIKIFDRSFILYCAFYTIHIYSTLPTTEEIYDIISDSPHDTHACTTQHGRTVFSF